jgi:hypothetical protein
MHRIRLAAPPDFSSPISPSLPATAEFCCNAGMVRVASISGQLVLMTVGSLAREALFRGSYFGQRPLARSLVQSHVKRCPPQVLKAYVKYESSAERPDGLEVIQTAAAVWQPDLILQEIDLRARKETKSPGECVVCPRIYNHFLAQEASADMLQKALSLEREARLRKIRQQPNLSLPWPDAVQLFLTGSLTEGAAPGCCSLVSCSRNSSALLSCGTKSR